MQCCMKKKRLRPSPKHSHGIAMLYKSATPNEPVPDATKYLNVSKEILQSLNDLDQDNIFHQYDNQFPVLEQHLIDFLSNQTNKNNNPESNALGKANDVYDPISGTCLECIELTKTLEQKVWGKYFESEID